MWIQTFHGAACDLEKADMLIIAQAASAASADENGKITFGSTAWNVLATFPNKAEGIYQLVLTRHEAIEDAKDQIAKFVKALNRLSSEIESLVENLMPEAEPVP